MTTQQQTVDLGSRSNCGTPELEAAQPESARPAIEKPEGIIPTAVSDENDKAESSPATTVSASRNSDLKEVPSELREVLQVASCLNNKPLEESMLACTLSVSSVSPLLTSAVAQRILIVVQEDEKVLYRFLSDDMRDQMYQSIPENYVSKLHVRIAQRLWDGGFDDKLVLKQFLRGEVSLMQDPNENYSSLAGLCLSVGRKAVRASDFASAATFMNFGIRLLEHSHHPWRNEYDLSLALHRAAAEANYCESNFDLAEASIVAVNENARCFRDTLGVCSTKVYVLGAQGRREEAIEVGLDTLRQLSEPLPSHPNRAQVLLAYARVRSMLGGKTNEFILRLPIMEDETKIAAMQMLNLIFSHVISARPLLVPLLVFRLVRLTLKYGLSVMSSVGFAKYGMVLCKMEQFDLGRRFAQLALKLYDRFPVQEWLPRVYLGVYAGVYSTIKPLECTVEPLRYAYRVGLETGDIEIALIEAHIYSTNLFALGRPLPVVEKALLSVRKENIVRKQIWMNNRLGPMLQLVQNLMGKSRANTEAKTDNMYDDDEYREPVSGDMITVEFMHFHKMILSYLFGDYKAAVENSDLCRGLHENAPTRHVAFTYLPLIQGLSALAQARETGRGNRGVIRMTRRLIRQLKQHVLQSPAMCSGKLFLLQADLAWFLGKHDVVYYKFTCAIALSSDAGILLDQALSNELAGWYMLERGDKETATRHLQEAQATYRKWGADAKVEHLAVQVAARLV